jgi:hypothetical protein
MPSHPLALVARIIVAMRDATPASPAHRRQPFDGMRHFCTMVLVDTLVLSIAPWIPVLMFFIGEARVLN